MNKKAKLSIDQSPIERLNDDCLAWILHYLPFEQRLNLERVSKQWQRCIFTFVTNLTIELGDWFACSPKSSLFSVYETLDVERVVNNKDLVFRTRIPSKFVRLLSKLADGVGEVRIRFCGVMSVELFNAIMEVARNSRRLTVHFFGTDLEQLKMMSRIIGCNVTALDICELGSEEDRKAMTKKLATEVLPHLTNLESFKDARISNILRATLVSQQQQMAKIILPNLRQIDVKVHDVFFGVDDEEEWDLERLALDDWKQFANIFDKQIESLYFHMYLNNVDYAEIIPKFVNLSEICLTTSAIRCDVDRQLSNFSEVLTKIALKCPKMKTLKLSIKLNQHDLASQECFHHLFSAISHFSHLTTFDFFLRFTGRTAVVFETESGSLFRPLHQCRHLKTFRCLLRNNCRMATLHSISATSPFANFFYEISSHLTHLYHIDIGAYTDSLSHLNNFKRLRSATFRFWDNKVDEEDLRKFIRSCPKLELLEIKGEILYFDTIIDAVIEAAKRRSRGDFVVVLTKFYSEFLFKLIKRSNDIPKNLRICFEDNL